jgi:hypothetical protein
VSTLLLYYLFFIEKLLRNKLRLSGSFVGGSCAVYAIQAMTFFLGRLVDGRVYLLRIVGDFGNIKKFSEGNG